MSPKGTHSINNEDKLRIVLLDHMAYLSDQVEQSTGGLTMYHTDMGDFRVLDKHILDILWLHPLVVLVG